MFSVLAVLGRGGVAGATFLGVMVAALGGASPALIVTLWIVGIVVDRLAQWVGARLLGVR